MIENVSFVSSGGVRLDAALLVRFPSSSRAFVREACAAGAVIVDGRPAEKGRKLKGGETITVVSLAEVSDNRVLPDRSIAVRTVFEDDALLAFDKPAGMSVQPLSRHETGTLMNGVVARWPEVVDVGDVPLMAGALHRIDTGTSGLVLVAKTRQVFESMRNQFVARAVEKRYLALVEGSVAAGGTLENDLVHDPTLPYCRMVVRPPDATNGPKKEEKPMRALTTFRPLALTRRGMEEQTLLEVTIRTGVTHQIRAQLAAAGMHIVNDRLYGAFAVEDMPGHRLHALSAAFTHPVSAEPCRIETSWPGWALKAMENGSIGNAVT